MHVRQNRKKIINHRNYTYLSQNSFKYVIDAAPFYIENNYDDVEDIFWFNHTLIHDIINSHAPMKHKKTVR